MTDSPISADVTILVSAWSPSFFDTISPAIAASEMLVASRRGAGVPGAVQESEERLREAGAFWGAGQAKGRS